MVNFNPTADFKKISEKLSENYAERRRFPRLSHKTSLQYRNLSANGNGSAPSAMKGTVTKDISAGGVRMMTDRFMPLDSKVKVEFSLSSNVKSISAEAKIAWVQKMPYNENFLVGLEFVDIKHEARVEVIRYVNERVQGAVSFS